MLNKTHLIFLILVVLPIASAFVTVEPNIGGGADLIIDLTHYGQDFAFEVYAECENGIAQNNWQSTIGIKSGTEKQGKISVSGGECGEIITCEVTYHPVGAYFTETVDFVANCSLCGTESEIYEKGYEFCDEGIKYQTNEYCNALDEVGNCEEEKGTNFNYTFPIIILLIAVIVLIFVITMKSKS